MRRTGPELLDEISESALFRLGRGISSVPDHAQRRARERRRRAATSPSRTRRCSPTRSTPAASARSSSAGSGSWSRRPRPASPRSAASRPTRSSSTSSPPRSRSPPADGQWPLRLRVGLGGFGGLWRLRAVRLGAASPWSLGVGRGRRPVLGTGSDADGQRDGGADPAAGRWASRSPPCRRRRAAPTSRRAGTRPSSHQSHAPRRRTPSPTTSCRSQRRPAGRHLDHDRAVAGRPRPPAAGRCPSTAPRDAAGRRPCAAPPRSRASSSSAAGLAGAVIPRRSGTPLLDGRAATNAVRQGDRPRPRPDLRPA